MDAKTWDAATDAQREAARDLSNLTPQLIGLEGWRIEVTKTYGGSVPHTETRRFIVGRSTGWRPIHLEVSRRTAMGGGAAAREYDTVRKLYKVWP